uniref:hypothetical protein n=1 Tax=Stappia sp. TaxID=1870903 RepID=UPI003BAC0CC9
MSEQAGRAVGQLEHVVGALMLARGATDQTDTFLAYLVDMALLEAQSLLDQRRADD